MHGPVRGEGFDDSILIYADDKAVRIRGRAAPRLQAPIRSHGRSLVDQIITQTEKATRLPERQVQANALVGSEDWIVRQKAAQQGYGLDRLVLDRNEHVRFAVAAQGYGLDALALDPSPHVRNRASGYLIAHYGNAFELDRWREKEPDKVFEDMALADFLADFPHPWTPRLMGLSYIRVLVPDSSEYYRLGHGESCWVLADEHAHEAYVNNAEAEEGLHFGVLAEDCPVYADLSRGRIIPFEVRGRKRPMCPIDWLRRHFTLSEDRLLPADLLATSHTASRPFS